MIYEVNLTLASLLWWASPLISWDGLKFSVRGMKIWMFYYFVLTWFGCIKFINCELYTLRVTPKDLPGVLMDLPKRTPLELS